MHILARIGILLSSLYCLPVSAQVIISGVTEPIADLTLSLPVSGRIEQLLVREGQVVSANQPLLSLDNRLEKLEVDRRQLIVKDRARLDEVAQREKILAAQWQQSQQLLASNSIARKLVEDEELLYKAAQAERLALENAKERELVELALAQETLKRRSLRAPISGIVVKLHFSIGESVTALEPVLQLVDAKKVRFVGNLPASAGVSLQLSDSVRIILRGEQDDIERPAKLVFISPVADPMSGMVEIHAEFDNADGNIRPGVAGQLLLVSAAR